MDLKNYLLTIQSDRKKKFIRTAIEMDIGIEILSEKFRLLKFVQGERMKYLFDDSFFFNRKPGTFFTKNKELTKILLRQNNIKTPTGIHAENLQQAIKLMKTKNILYPVVVKPLDAAKGIGVTVGVKNQIELEKAIQYAKKCIKQCSNMTCSGDFLVEKMKTGKDFRILVLNNKVIACTERVPAYIKGNGSKNIETLIRDFNKNRPRNYILKIDKELLNTLKRNDLNISSVLKSGQQVKLRENANISSGGRAIDKTSEISDHFINIALKSAKVLGLNYAGVDIMTNDITSNSSDQPYFVIEINGAPDYDIHEKPVVTGEGVNVTRILVEEFMKQNG